MTSQTHLEIFSQHNSHFLFAWPTVCWIRNQIYSPSSSSLRHLIAVHLCPLKEVLPATISFQQRSMVWYQMGHELTPMDMPSQTQMIVLKGHRYMYRSTVVVALNWRACPAKTYAACKPTTTPWDQEQKYSTPSWCGWLEPLLVSHRIIAFGTCCTVGITQLGEHRQPICKKYWQRSVPNPAWYKIVYSNSMI